jgi:hypothetical protein
MINWVGIAAVRGYSGINSSEGADLDITKFLEVVPIEVEKAGLTNIGHPLYKPFMVRRFGADIGLPETSNLAYDQVTAKWWSWNQLQEGIRVIAAARLSTMDDYHLNVGDTIAIEDDTFGVRRLWLIEGVSETQDGIDLLLLDVIGG